MSTPGNVDALCHARLEILLCQLQGLRDSRRALLRQYAVQQDTVATLSASSRLLLQQIRCTVTMSMGANGGLNGSSIEAAELHHDDDHDDAGRPSIGPSHLSASCCHTSKFTTVPARTSSVLFPPPPRLPPAPCSHAMAVTVEGSDHTDDDDDEDEVVLLTHSRLSGRRTDGAAVAGPPRRCHPPPRRSSTAVGHQPTCVNTDGRAGSMQYHAPPGGRCSTVSSSCASVAVGDLRLSSVPLPAPPLATGGPSISATKGSAVGCPADLVAALCSAAGAGGSNSSYHATLDMTTVEPTTRGVPVAPPCHGGRASLTAAEFATAVRSMSVAELRRHDVSFFRQCLPTLVPWLKVPLHAAHAFAMLHEGMVLFGDELFPASIAAAFSRSAVSTATPMRCGASPPFTSEERTMLQTASRSLREILSHQGGACRQQLMRHNIADAHVSQLRDFLEARGGIGSHQ